MNADFRRIARRDKKAFLSEQCKEIEESLQENWRYQENISCKDGHNKGQNWYGEDIKKWQEYTEELCMEELYKKDLNDPDNHDGVITHLETDIWNAKSSGLRKHPYEQS